MAPRRLKKGGKRRTAHEHPVRTTHPRYHVKQYTRGTGEAPPALPRTDSRSPYGRGMETREGVTKTRHAWRVDDSLRPTPKHVYGEVIPEWRNEDNRRDVTFVDHPNAKNVVVRMLTMDLTREKAKLKHAKRVQTAIKRRVAKEKRRGRLSGRTQENLERATADVNTFKESITKLKGEIKDRKTGSFKPKKAIKTKTAKGKKVKNADQLVGHTTMASAHIIEDYPYGRRLRTQMRVWVETKEKFGQRMVTQTLNPKTKKWNKPKKGTYSHIIVLKKKVQTDGRTFIRPESPETGMDVTVKSLKKWGDQHELDDYQKEALTRIQVGVNARKYIKYTVTTSEPIDLFGDPKASEKLQKLIDRDKGKKERDAKVLDSALDLSYRELRNKDQIDKL